VANGAPIFSRRQVQEVVELGTRACPKYPNSMCNNLQNEGGSRSQAGEADLEIPIKEGFNDIIVVEHVVCI